MSFYENTIVTKQDLPKKELEEYYWHKALKILEEDLKVNS